MAAAAAATKTTIIITNTKQASQYDGNILFRKNNYLKIKIIGFPDTRIRTWSK
jgi:hypothetical protein